MDLEFSTKAQTLLSLQNKLSSAKIAPICFFKVKDWETNPLECISNIKKKLVKGPWIVRSSFQYEDNINQSGAGKFLSILDVNEQNLETSVNQVISSHENHDNDEILIQPLLKNVVRSGVVFSHDPSTCSPYRIVSWFEGSDTTVVTSGKDAITWKQAARSKIQPPKEIKTIFNLLNELLSIYKNLPIDFEFALTTKENSKNDEELWLLQVRPLIFIKKIEKEEVQTNKLQIIHEKIDQVINDHPFLMGKKNVYSVMSDWNPAEMIGLHPRPLALSLYKELITDSIWAYQRHNYGYRNLRSFPLMINFFGMPYIDLRVSFNSFIPSRLEENIAIKLVDYYIDRVVNQPALHDKIEFEIVYSCYTLDLPERIKKLNDYGFSDQECNTIVNNLKQLTNVIIHSKKGLWHYDAKKIEVLNYRRKKLYNSNANILERIYWLLEDTKRYGTLPFAGLARSAFIAVQMLQSLLNIGILNQSDYEKFMKNISTISSELTNDRLSIDKVSFLKRYGFLRPGTYDILSPRYDKAEHLYFDWNQSSQSIKTIEPFSFTISQKNKLEKILNFHKLNQNTEGIFEFIKESIRLREMAKFNFTRNISDALELIAEYAEDLNISRDEISYCDINAFKQIHIDSHNPKEIIKNSINQGKSNYKISLHTSLPPLITKPEDVWAFKSLKVQPNFITQKKITAFVADINNLKSLSGSIVCIPNADPGFDWLFSHSIAGLITAWGGVNSHMAIRAGELEIPSIIGTGEELFNHLSNSKKIYIDCASAYVEAIN